LGLGAAAQAQSTTTSSETKKFEVVAVDGNNVVVKTATGAKEYSVPEDFRFTVDGKQVSVHELQPGMKGTATLTTKTTTTPVHITEVKNGEVVQKSGNSVIVRTDTGIKMFSEGDMSKRNIEIIKDGKPVNITELRVGDKLSATIVTTGTPKVVTERQLKATLASNGAPPAAAAGSKSAGASTTSSHASSSAGAAPAGHAKKLPKTASSVPETGLIGALFLAMGLSLTVARSRRGRL
jgi:hypothetical protein